MTQNTRVDRGDRASEPKFYLPAGSVHSLVADQLGRVWAALFDHRVGRAP